MSSELINNSNIREIGWQYVPDIYPLSRYLCRNDLIQLSSTCKLLRQKFKSKLLSKMELMGEGEIIPGKSNEQSKKKHLPILLKMLQKDYLDRYNIVNHCVFWEFFNSGFAKNFFSLFANITRLELYSSRDNDHFTAFPMCNSIVDSESIQKYFKFYPIENINEEYTNLKTVTIMKDRMLSNMMVTMKSLTDVTILTRQRFNLNNLAQFLSLNPQLEKLTAPTYFLECNLVNSILKMNQLKQLNIKSSYYRPSGDIIYSHINTSIEYLNISGYICEDRLVPFLNSLKSLKVLEFSDFSLYTLVNIGISAYEDRIPLLHLNGLWHGKEAIESFVNLEIFDKIRFTNMFDLDFYLTNYKGDDLENWKIYHLDPANSEEFTIININQE
ncbi:hypothetical protein CONCODRAFT_70972 [Conidiobolus coronatus NRRL 28638]|uniref:F-box domain-containing protein n=1 Tax=Conidiobolus coronatus (strain ATCC 28846 / CBS 209.66 / NRRL 28638) TaxID=796925 RepID=A0A137P539_CONC2|nr:hypothetical protein CONCODRAFT_70972 [Conidiobolus coronatus NRRL 28638]|eukprot:KXN70044.1 hypothetical protein CONCODRAFT_70972 [Conidiobolus coronatus NRRL 28638]